MTESTKEIINRIIGEDKGILLTTSTTLTTCSTYNINSWGYVNIIDKILIEQLAPKTEYFYNIDGEIGFTSIKYECKNCGTITTPTEIDKDKIRCSCGKILTFKEEAGLFIKNRTFRFKNKPKDTLYLTPSIEDLRKNMINLKLSCDTQELFNEIEQTLSTLFEFHNPQDSKICALYILFSYILPYFNSSFYLGIDATKGSGKTTLLEIICLLTRHGFLADVSPASIPRLKEKYDLSIFIDELDQLSAFEDLQGLLRKGQRRGNKYVRLNKNSLEEEIYEAFGIYGFSFRSVVEDAFKQRSVLIRTARAKDSRLSIINLHKAEILKPLLTKIWLWYFQNFFIHGSISSKSYEVEGGFTPEGASK